MIKKYVGTWGQDKDNMSLLFVGMKDDIKAIYKSIARNTNNPVIPWGCDFPIFSEWKHVYAIEIEHDYQEGFHYMYVLNSDTAMAEILEGNWKEVGK